MKYRIIHEVDGNRNEHYEVQFYQYSFFGGKWVNHRIYRNSGFEGYSLTARYDTLEEAQKVVNARTIMRTVAEHGVVYDRTEF